MSSSARAPSAPATRTPESTSAPAPASHSDATPSSVQLANVSPKGDSTPTDGSGTSSPAPVFTSSSPPASSSGPPSQAATTAVIPTPVVRPTSSSEPPETSSSTLRPSPASSAPEEPASSSTKDAAPPPAAATTPPVASPTSAAVQGSEFGSPSFNPLSMGYGAVVLPSGVLPSGVSLSLPLTAAVGSILSDLGPSSFTKARRPTNSVSPPVADPSASVSQAASSARDSANRAHLSGIVTGAVVAAFLLLLVGLVLRPRMCRKREKRDSVPVWNATTLAASSRRASHESVDSMEKPPVGFEFAGSEDSRARTPAPRSDFNLGSEMLFPTMASYPEFVPLPQPPLQTRQVAPPISTHRLQHATSTVFSDSASFHLNFAGPPSSDFGGGPGQFPATPPMRSDATLTSLYSPGTWANLLASPDDAPGADMSRLAIPSPEPYGRRSPSPEMLNYSFDESGRKSFESRREAEDDASSLYSQQTRVSVFPQSTRGALYARVKGKLGPGGPLGGEGAGEGFPTTPLDEGMEHFF